MLSYLFELRRRALSIIFVFFMLFLLSFFFANSLFSGLIAPLTLVLPQGSLIATQITSSVVTPLKLAADVAFLWTAPFALLQLWRFIAPGLYRHERYNLRNTMIFSLLLFCSGVLFCFYLVLPLMFQFFIKTMPHGVRLMPDMDYALNFITRMLLLFGLCFQIPLLCLMLIRLKWVDLPRLKKMRPYVIVSAFIVGMLLTPPDVLSQIMLAVPLCLLYEVGILLAGLSQNRLQ